MTSIHIPAPCSENWNNMQPNDKGRFCTLCQKTVVDFSAYSNDEILAYLQQFGSTCGRIKVTIKEDNRQTQRSLWLPIKKIATAVLVLLGFTGVSCKTASKNITNSNKIELPEPEDFVTGDIAVDPPVLVQSEDSNRYILGGVGVAFVKDTTTSD